MSMDLTNSNQGNDEDPSFMSAFTEAAAQPTEPTNTNGLQDGSTQTDSNPPTSQSIPEQPNVPQQPATQENIGGLEPSSQAIAQEPRAIHELARNAGLNVSDTATDAEIVHALQNHIAQMQGYASLGQYLAPHAARLNQALTQPPAPPQAQENPKDEWDLNSHFRKQWEIADWKPEYQTAIDRGLVTRDESGMYAPVPGMEMLVAPFIGQMNQALIQRNNNWQKLMQGNPVEFMHNALIEPIRRQMRAEFEQVLAQRESQTQATSFVDNWEKQNASWLYDQNNQPTAEGQWFISAVQRIAPRLGNDYAAAVREVDALRSTYREFHPPQQPSPPQPAAPKAPVQQPAATATQQSSFIQDAAQRASHTPRAGGTVTQSPDYQPENIAPMELQNLFTNSWRAQRGQSAIN